MNIRQTAQVLAYIASTHPSYPRYSDEDKQRVVMAYFRLLWPYSVSDVMDAVDRASRKSRPYAPGAYDIEAEIIPHYNTTKFLNQAQIDSIDAKIEALEASQRACVDIGEWKAKQAQIEVFKGQIAALYHEASERAKEEYQNRELELSAPDRRAISYEAES